MRKTKKTFFTIVWLSSSALAGSLEDSPFYTKRPELKPVVEPVVFLYPRLEKSYGIYLSDKPQEKVEISPDGTPLNSEINHPADWSLTFHSQVFFEDAHLIAKKRHPFFSSKNFIPFEIQKSAYLALISSPSSQNKQCLSSRFSKLFSSTHTTIDTPIEKETIFIYETFSPFEEEEFKDFLLWESEQKSETSSLTKIHLALLPLEKPCKLNEERNIPSHTAFREKGLPISLLPICSISTSFQEPQKEAYSKSNFVAEKEKELKTNKISFRIPKNFKPNFCIELNHKDLKNPSIALFNGYYSYLDASVESEDPMYLGDETPFPYYAFIEQDPITKNSLPLTKHSNSFEIEQIDPKENISTKEPTIDAPFNASLEIKNIEPQKIETEYLPTNLTPIYSKNTSTLPPSLFSTPLDVISSQFSEVPRSPKAFLESSFEEKKNLRNSAPNTLLSLLGQPDLLIENSFSSKKEKSLNIFFSKYLEPIDKTLFRWANFSVQFPSNPIYQPIHHFCEYIAELIQPYEEKLNTFFAYFVSKYPLDEGRSYTITAHSTPIDIKQLTHSLEKARLFNSGLLSLSLPKILRDFRDEFSTQASVISPSSIQVQDEKEFPKETLEIADKLESEPSQIVSKFVVFHHPLSLSKTPLNVTDSKPFLPQKSAALEKDIALKTLFFREIPTENMPCEIQTLYLPQKMENEKNHLKVLYSSGLFLTHVNILHPGFIKISAQKEALLQLFDAKTETLLADKDRLDLLPGQKFRTSISLEHKKMVCFEPIPNEFNENFVIEKMEITILDSPQRKIHKHFQNTAINLMEIPSASNSMSIIAGAKMLNDQSRKLFSSIDSLTNLPYLASDASDQFFTKASSTALSSKEGYGIEIELELYESTRPSILDQEILFVLDGSKNTSIGHFGIYKQAIMRSLKSLNNDTRFNILFVGKTVQKLFDSSVSVSQDKQILAKRFLEKIESFQGSETGQLLKTCASLIPQEDDCTLTTVILLADSVKPQKQLTYLQETKKIIEKNKGNFQLLTTSLSTKDQQDLKFISMIGSGKNHIIASESSFVRKFCSMVRKIKYPYLANLSITPLSEGVEILPQNGLVGTIFLNQPLKFYAICEKNTPFILMIQSLCDGKIVKILKEIKPISDESIRSKMKTEIQLKRAADAFKKYVKKENPANLEETNRQLELFDIKL